MKWIENILSQLKITNNLFLVLLQVLIGSPFYVCKVLLGQSDLVATSVCVPFHSKQSTQSSVAQRTPMGCLHVGDTREDPLSVCI